MSRSREREWRAGYRAGVEDAANVLLMVRRKGIGFSLELDHAFDEVRKLFLANPRGPEKGAAKRYGINE